MSNWHHIQTTLTFTVSYKCSGKVYGAIIVDSK